uniref:Uncharacterized protein n=1 Tax=Chromera velia CCMP2878 TaxID=1169474 RepID=A0A0G4IG20_9ALVE|eukprot:Cvel_136.t1-p1 / transcript=Cvel_136.t1 / gene=Cvel_136 / organism=Chromera_velia_CCMP2878 / gene_product=hypothetical protein / transcript_product=hypothetical protein / location=Cvel_scaffold9:208219-209076(-) / protein_length=286 / sequence_SO=supercontig / SO=protein_coding / is_pseudo=false
MWRATAASPTSPQLRGCGVCLLKFALEFGQKKRFSIRGLLCRSKVTRGLALAVPLAITLILHFQTKRYPVYAMTAFMDRLCDVWRMGPLFNAFNPYVTLDYDAALKLGIASLSFPASAVTIFLEQKTFLLDVASILLSMEFTIGPEIKVAMVLMTSLVLRIVGRADLQGNLHQPLLRLPGLLLAVPILPFVAMWNVLRGWDDDESLSVRERDIRLPLIVTLFLFCYPVFWFLLLSLLWIASLWIALETIEQSFEEARRAIEKMLSRPAVENFIQSSKVLNYDENLT